MAGWRTLALAASISAFLTLNAVKDTMAGVNVDVNIGFPSPFVFPAPPPVVVIPGTYVYMVPEIDVSVLFYHGYWYRPHGDHWFRAHSYDGPWVHVVPGHVPRALRRLPPHYRSVPPGYHRISHRELEANWGKWERNKHWHKDNAWREGRRGKESNERSTYRQVQERQGDERPARKGHNGSSGHERGRDRHGRHEGPRD